LDFFCVIGVVFQFQPAYALAETFNHFKDSPFIHVHDVKANFVAALWLQWLLVSVECLSIIFVCGKKKIYKVPFDKETSW
jgi:hypothetical protein